MSSDNEAKDFYPTGAYVLKVERSGPAPFIWVHRKSSSDRECSIERIAVPISDRVYAMERFRKSSPDNSTIELLDLGQYGVHLCFNQLNAQSPGSTVGLYDGKEWVEFINLEPRSKALLRRLAEDRGFVIRNPDPGFSENWCRSQAAAWLGFHIRPLSSGTWEVQTVEGHLPENLRFAAPLQFNGCQDDVLWELDKYLKAKGQATLREIYREVLSKL